MLLDYIEAGIDDEQDATIHEETAHRRNNIFKDKVLKHIPDMTYDQVIYLTTINLTNFVLAKEAHAYAEIIAKQENKLYYMTRDFQFEQFHRKMLHDLYIDEFLSEHSEHYVYYWKGSPTLNTLYSDRYQMVKSWKNYGPPY